MWIFITLVYSEPHFDVYNFSFIDSGGNVLNGWAS